MSMKTTHYSVYEKLHLRGTVPLYDGQKAVIEFVACSTGMRSVRDDILPKHPYCIIIDWKHYRYKYYSNGGESRWRMFRASEFNNMFRYATPCEWSYYKFHGKMEGYYD